MTTNNRPFTYNNPTLARTICAGAAIVMLLVTGCIRGDSVSDEEKQQAIEAAMEVYQREAAGGGDLSNGPCIAQQLDDLPDWSVDIAHDPRQDVDNQAENQCQAYRDGETHHFVELDPDGNLIRAE